MVRGIPLYYISQLCWEACLVFLPVNCTRYLVVTLNFLFPVLLITSGCSTKVGILEYGSHAVQSVKVLWCDSYLIWWDSIPACFFKMFFFVSLPIKHQWLFKLETNHP